jgi:Protein of unknown function (DUF5661)
MKAKVEWNDFRMRFLTRNTVFVEENDTAWIFLTWEGPLGIECLVPKSERAEDNIMFIERNFSSRANVCRAELHEPEEMMKHGDDPDENFDPDQLALGINVEMEHTDDQEIAKQIAKAHLSEIPDYYIRLKQMEEQAKAEGG